jgi:hypothetical protein
VSFEVGVSAGLIYALLDTNVTAGYYLARSLTSQVARRHIATIIDSVRTGGSKHSLYIPNICIAETFSVFMKYAFGKWNPHLKHKKTIDKRVYEHLVSQFQKDIHNGRLLYQYELSRYHILAIDLVAPIDHHYQHTRGKKNHRPMGTFDHLYVAMGIHLAHIDGNENVVLLTADDRISNIVSRCRVSIADSTVRKLKLRIAEEVTGRAFSPALFPRCLNLKTATRRQLAEVFGEWPLPVSSVPDAYRYGEVGDSRIACCRAALPPDGDGRRLGSGPDGHGDLQSLDVDPRGCTPVISLR